jgi:hydrogenase-4 component F
MAYASLHAGLDATLNYPAILKNAPHCQKYGYTLAFILLLVGYGTKMGLAPMHTWKPDAYGESPVLSEPFSPVELPVAHFWPF